MGQTLKIQEINKLLKAVNSGEIDEEKINNKKQESVKPYDFRRPNRLSKSHIRSLEMIHDSYGKILSNYLTAEVGRSIGVRFDNIEQTTYEKLIKSVPNPALISIFNMPPLKQKLLLEIGPKFGFQMIEILCGGEVLDNPEIREFTDIEKNIVKELVTNMLSKLKIAWEEVMIVDTEFERLETNPMLGGIMSLNESLIQISFTIDVRGIKSRMNLCIPYDGIKDISDKLYNNSLLKEGKREGEFKEIIEKGIIDSHTNLNVILGNTEVTVKEFLELNKGDVLQLDQSVNKPLKMLIEDKNHYFVQPGIHDGKMAVQVLDIVEKEVDENEG